MISYHCDITRLKPQQDYASDKATYLSRIENLSKDHTVTLVINEIKDFFFASKSSSIIKSKQS